MKLTEEKDVKAESLSRVKQFRKSVDRCSFPGSGTAKFILSQRCLDVSLQLSR